MTTGRRMYRFPETHPSRRRDSCPLHSVKTMSPGFSTGVLLVVLFLTGCTVGSFFKSRECTDIASPAENTFSTSTPQGSAWLYQLQNTDPDQITVADYDIIVIDYSRDRSEEHTSELQSHSFISYAVFCLKKKKKKNK